jgi:hypothetical protein
MVQMPDAPKEVEGGLRNTEAPPVLNYAPATPAKNPWAPSLLAMLLIMVASLDVCGCGHMSLIGLPFSTAAATVACYGWLKSPLRFPLRVLPIIVFRV